MIKNIFCPLMALLLFSCTSYSQPLVNEAKPWTYWWWHGSAVDSANITYNLEEFSKAGIGGVHIIPIYGVKGYESKFIDFLSDKWMQMLDFTSRECGRLGIGLDMTIGTGWPFGGQQVTDEMSSCRLIDTVFTVNKNTSVNINLYDLIKTKTLKNNHLNLVGVNAFYNRRRVDLSNFVDSESNLNWQNTNEDAKVIVLFSENSIQQVKRAAPGGKGNVVDPFSSDALNNYLRSFNNAFNNYSGKPVRAFYHDSYEYFGADWSASFEGEFLKRRGYSFLDELPAFLGYSDSGHSARILCDYRHTISELHEEFILNAALWSAGKDAGFRCQAHGAPANLLDVYAAASIPETEVFGTPKTYINGLATDTVFTRKEVVEPLLLKFASSATHVAGKNLISSETGTWLTEHFRESLSQIKPEVDQLFVAGVNHIFFHGIPYSPKEEEWPGWQFYASTNYGPTNSLWRNLSALTGYITRCQSVLQEGSPDNSILLYFPIWDLWNTNTGRLLFFQMHNPEAWLFNSGFYKTAKALTDKGFSFDYISDKQLQKLSANSGEILSAKNKYKAIVIPSCKYLPIETLEKFFNLTRSGIPVFFVDELPGNLPGFFNYSERRAELDNIKRQILIESKKTESSVFIGELTEITKQLMPISEWGLAKHKLNFIKRKSAAGKNYFIVNQTSEAVNDWIDISEKIKSVNIIDPLNGKTGKAKIKTTPDGASSVYLQIESGASLILKTSSIDSNEKDWVYTEQLNSGIEIKGNWQVEFIDGAPELPKPHTINQLTSWTNFKDEECRRFFGTARYKIKFSNPNPDVKSWTIDLGKVCESARIKINKVDNGTVWAYPFKINFETALANSDNELEIEVTNCAANRIKDLDARGVYWKKFYDINFVNINYKKFDASSWVPVNSGLLGPVKLIPNRIIK